MLDIPERVIERFRTIVEPGPADECWLWPRSIGSHGYGQMAWQVGDGKIACTTVHRIAWLAAGNEIPEGMTLHHRCYERRCVNVAHLEVMANVPNAQDNANFRKTQCVRGHAFDDTNTYVDPRGHRRCRTCRADARRARV